MERYESMLLKNEQQINRNTAMLCICQLGLVAVVMLLNRLGLIARYSYADDLSWKLVLVAVLLLPAGVVWLLRREGKWVKYFIMLCSVLASGLSYVIFNAQATLLLLFPTVLAALYYNQRLSIVTFILSVCMILLSHLTASYLILPVWYRNPYGFRYVFIDTAIPQAMFYICFAVVIGLLNRRTLRLFNDVYKSSREREVLALEKDAAETLGRLDERERISRDIHNSVGHTITAAIFALEAARLQRPTDPEAAEEKTSRAIERMRESMDIIRNSVRVLDKHNLLTVQELCKTLTLCSRQMELDTTVGVVVEFPDIAQRELELPLPSDYIGFLYGAVQEGISNGVRHGGARNFRLQLRILGENLELTIANDGRIPAMPLKEGFGLKKLRSYAASVGGSVELLSREEFAVVLCLPL